LKEFVLHKYKTMPSNMIQLSTKFFVLLKLFSSRAWQLIL